MFQYEYEKRPPSSNSCDSRTRDWTRTYPSQSRASSSRSHATRPLPPRPIVCERIPSKPTVPLKVWVIASASCFAVCAALVLATIVITKWGTSETFTSRELYASEPVSNNPHQTKAPKTKTTEPEPTPISEEIDNDIQFPILEKLFFKNIVTSRDKTKKPNTNLVTKQQLHPINDDHLQHEERKIEKKDRPRQATHLEFPHEFKRKHIPEFKPTLPDVFINRHSEIKLPDGFVTGLNKPDDYEEYYNDENLYDDYMQSNTMTSYLIEKVQELHDWITSDPDFEVVKNSTKRDRGNDFGQLLKALNESIIDGNVTIVMLKLKDIYFGDNYTHTNHTRKVILSNSTDLLSFGILSLDVMLLHNIQLMAWENQEGARNKMLKDPEVFAFNALFLEPGKVEAKKNEFLHHHENSPAMTKRQNFRQDSEDFEIGKNILENVLDIGMSTARAAIHLGRAYKNTKIVLSQLSISNRESPTANLQNQISRNVDGNAHALNHLQTSFSDSAANMTSFYTELDCVWLLYCKNLMATSKLNAPYGTMARINGMALRMLTGELSAEKALDTMIYELLTGWTELRCTDMFPRCSSVDPASIVMDSILQPMRKTINTSNRLK